MTYRWLTVEWVTYLHDSVVKNTGGSLGILDTSALESTVNRPQQLNYYHPEASIYDLAACLGYGFAKNHCFLDGNKRTAYECIFVFLQLNKIDLRVPEVEIVLIMESLAKDEISQEELSMWLKAHCYKL